MVAAKPALGVHVTNLRARTGAGLQPCLEPVQYVKAEALRYAFN